MDGYAMSLAICRDVFIAQSKRQRQALLRCERGDFAHLLATEIVSD